ncbi:CU044_2847 family protein [Streptomyces sp. NPDC058466]|uniref:CU044_2847 family protein n=1 Tax=Streptomyces sp. NPDC058466 TaxID=3346512 RepID=UPI003658C0F0
MGDAVTRIARVEMPDGTPVWARISGAEELEALSGELSYTDTGFGERVEAQVESLRSVIVGVARSLADPLRAVRPDEVSVEFGIELTAKAGKVVGLLADGEAKAGITVTLTWNGGPPDLDAAPPAAGGTGGTGRPDPTAAAQGGGTGQPGSAVSPHGGGGTGRPDTSAAPQGGGSGQPGSAVAPHGVGGTGRPDTSAAAQGGGSGQPGSAVAPHGGGGTGQPGPATGTHDGASPGAPAHGGDAAASVGGGV